MSPSSWVRAQSILDVENTYLWSQASGRENNAPNQQMDEFKNDAYENANIYNERTKRWYDKHILRK